MITISNETALRLLEDRLKFALDVWGDISNFDLYSEMYLSYLDLGYNYFDPMEIVDNDIINYTKVIYKGEPDYPQLLACVQAKEHDVSEKAFKDCVIAYIETISDDKERILVRLKY